MFGATAGERRPFVFVILFAIHFNNDVFVFVTEAGCCQPNFFDLCRAAVRAVLDVLRCRSGERYCRGGGRRRGGDQRRHCDERYSNISFVGIEGCCSSYFPISIVNVKRKNEMEKGKKN